jgi:hypothetical protein
MGKRHRSSSSPLATLCLCGLPAPAPSALRPPPAAVEEPRLPGSTLPVVSQPHPTHQPSSVSPLCGPLLGTATSGLEQLVSLLALVDGVAVVHRARAEDLRTAEGGVHLPWRDFTSQQLPAAVVGKRTRTTHERRSCNRPGARIASNDRTRTCAVTRHSERVASKRRCCTLFHPPQPPSTRARFRRTGVAAGTPPCPTRDPLWLGSHAYRGR